MTSTSSIIIKDAKVYSDNTAWIMDNTGCMIYCTAAQATRAAFILGEDNRPCHAIVDIKGNVLDVIE